jgi:hypothetical protein
MKTSAFPLFIALSIAAAGTALARGPQGGPPAAPATAPTATVPTTAVDINESVTCRGGGTRTLLASYNPSTGALSSTLTFAACVERNSTQNGSVTTNGTLLQGSGSNLYNLTLSTSVDLERSDGTDSVARVCARTMVGTYDLTAQTFDGTITQSSCVEDIVATQHGDIVQQLLRDGPQP